MPVEGLRGAVDGHAHAHGLREADGRAAAPRELWEGLGLWARRLAWGWGREGFWRRSLGFGCLELWRICSEQFGGFWRESLRGALEVRYGHLGSPLSGKKGQTTGPMPGWTLQLEPGGSKAEFDRLGVLLKTPGAKAVLPRVFLEETETMAHMKLVLTTSLSIVRIPTESVTVATTSTDLRFFRRDADIRPSNSLHGIGWIFR